MAEDRCICCGEVIPEGMMVCPNCSVSVKPKTNNRLYAVRDMDTGKLVSDITNPRRKYWDRKVNAVSAMNSSSCRFKHRNAKLVVFELVEVEDGK